MERGFWPGEQTGRTTPKSVAFSGLHFASESERRDSDACDWGTTFPGCQIAVRKVGRDVPGEPAETSPCREYGLLIVSPVSTASSGGLPLPARAGWRISQNVVGNEILSIALGIYQCGDVVGLGGIAAGRGGDVGAERGAGRGRSASLSGRGITEFAVSIQQISFASGASGARKS